MEAWGTHQPAWAEGIKQRPFQNLRQDLNADVVVVGSGITGLMTAVNLQRAGLTVVIVTAGEVADGATSFSTGHLTQVPDCTFSQLISNFGEEGAKLFVKCSGLAIDTIEKLASPECDFKRVSGFKSFLESQSQEADLAADLGLQVEKSKEFFEIKDQAMFDPKRFVLGLAKKFSEDSGQIFENSRVLKVDDGTPARVDTEFGSVTARAIILATHTPLGVSLALQTRLIPFISYAMAAKLQTPPAYGLHWDSSTPYNYARPWKDGLWIIGGRDHKTGQEPRPMEKYLELRDYIQNQYGFDEIRNYWSGEIFESLDYLPFIGKIPFTTALYTGTGYAGNGLTLGVVAAQTLTEIILDRRNAYTDLFDPLRFKPLAGGHSFIAQNASVAKWMITDHLHHGDLSEIKNLSPNDGRLVDVAGRKLAVYRNEKGGLHVLSSKCTHLGGTVHWNGAEKTWDCPCHGARFKATGEVMEGPQLKDLEDIPLRTEENPGVTSSPGLSPMEQLGLQS